MPYIKLNNLGLTYQSTNQSSKIFENVNVTFGPSGLVGIVGESGCGKSSLLNMVASYQNVEKGEIDIGSDKSEISTIFQNFNLIDHLNVIENVCLPLILKGETYQESIRLARLKLNEVGIPELANRRISEISGGQQARVSLARGIILNPAIILADEPTGSLDRENSIQVMSLLKDLSKNSLILVVTHDEELATRFCDEIYEIKNYNLVKIHEKPQPREEKEAIRSHINKFKRVKFKENIRLSYSFLKSRLKKIVASTVFCSLCFALLFMTLNVNSNGLEMLDELSSSYMDYTCVNLVEKRKIEISNKDMSLIKNVRLSKQKQRGIKGLYPDLECYPSLDGFIFPYFNLKSDGKYLESKVFLLPCFPDQTKLVGSVPCSYSEIIVNQNFLDINPSLKVGSCLNYSNDLIVQTNYMSNQASDVLHLNTTFKIVGVSKEKCIVGRASVYYDYLKMYDKLAGIKLVNASKTYGYDVRIKDRLTYMSYDDDTLTCFKTIAKCEDPVGLSEKVSEAYQDEVTVNNAGLDIANSTNDLISSFSKIVILFLFLAIACSFFLELVFIDNLYEEKRNELAIYLSFHISKKTFYNLGEGQITIVSAIIIAVTLLIFIALSIIGNAILVRLGLPAFFNLNLKAEYIGLLLLLSYVFSYFSSQIPLKNIYSNQLVMALKGE